MQESAGGEVMNEPTIVRVSVENAGKVIADLVKENVKFDAEEFEYTGDHKGSGWITIRIFGY